MASEFKSYAKKTAENILEMAKIVTEAKKLNEKQFKYFCNLIGFKPDSGTIRKFVQIGSKYEMLKNNASNLPSNWTTIYQLSRLSSGVLEDFISTGVVTANISGAAVGRLFNKNIEKQENTSNIAVYETVPNGTQLTGYSFSVTLHGAPTEDMKIRVKDALAMLKSFDLSPVLSPSLEGFMLETLPLVA